MLSLVLIPGEGSGQPRELKTVRVAIIGGQIPLPIAIGQAHGFFEKFGVRVTAETMWTSQELRDGLAAGKYDVAHAAVDNSVATAEINARSNRHRPRRRNLQRQRVDRAAAYQDDGGAAWGYDSRRFAGHRLCLAVAKDA